MNVTPLRRTRRTHFEEFKRSLIDACGEPGVSVAGVALANGINANQLRRLDARARHRATRVVLPVFTPSPRDRQGYESFAYLKDVLICLPTQP